MDESAVEETPQAHVASHVNTGDAASRVDIPETRRNPRGKQRRRGRRRH